MVFRSMIVTVLLTATLSPLRNCIALFMERGKRIIYGDTMGDTICCGWRFEHVINISLCSYIVKYHKLKYEFWSILFRITRKSWKQAGRKKGFFAIVLFIMTNVLFFSTCYQNTPSLNIVTENMFIELFPSKRFFSMLYSIHMFFHSNVCFICI